MEKRGSQAIADFKKLFERLSYSQDYSTTFSSFLDFAMWRMAPYLADEMESELQRLERMYKPEMGVVMGEMFENWAIACDNDGEGFTDALGDLFMECVSFGRNGQFFTPQPICDMMAQLTYGDDLKEGQRVCDPACGSGRTLLAMGKMQRRMKFYGSDNDHTCVKMAVLNLMVNSMEGEIAHMDCLSMEHYKSYHIKNIRYGTHYLPMLSITGKDQTQFKQRLIAAMAETPVPEQPKPAELKPAIPQPKLQQLFLDF